MNKHEEPPATATERRRKLPPASGLDHPLATRAKRQTGKPGPPPPPSRARRLWKLELPPGRARHISHLRLVVPCSGLQCHHAWACGGSAASAASWRDQPARRVASCAPGGDGAHRLHPTGRHGFKPQRPFACQHQHGSRKGLLSSTAGARGARLRATGAALSQREIPHRRVGTAT